LEQHRTERRLAAILAADVVGYSRLTRLDEEGTLTRLRALRRDLIDPALAEHRGRLVKTTGDGLLVEFSSVVDAVRCALRIQQGVAILNGDVRVEKRIEYRIGINLGDVVVDGDDLLGDGVNIAARLETLAEPGAICISEDAYRQLRGKIDIAAQDLGAAAQEHQRAGSRLRRPRTRADGAQGHERSPGQGEATATLLRPAPVVDHIRGSPGTIAADAPAWAALRSPDRAETPSPPPVLLSS